MTNSKKGIEKHAIGYYRAVKAAAAESKAYAERVADRKEYSGKYTGEQRAEFRMRRGYLIHQVELKRKALFMSIESTLKERGQLNDIKEPGVTSEDYFTDGE